MCLLRCAKCKEYKKTSYFSRKNNKLGYSVVCKDCHNKYVREVWYPKNKAKQKASSKKWKEKNNVYILSKRYNVSEEEIADLLSSSDKGCQICGKKGKLHVDHCHKTGKLRGLLCMECNMSLGRVGDDIRGIMRFVNYLKNSD